MDFSSRQYSDVVVAIPAGRIDHLTAADFEQALLPIARGLAPGEGGMVLDFSGVDYISSVGLRVLMVAAKEVRQRRARIAVTALTPIVGEIFAISRFDAVLDVRGSVRAALEEISAAALGAYDAHRRSAGV